MDNMMVSNAVWSAFTLITMYISIIMFTFNVHLNDTRLSTSLYKVGTVISM